MICIPSYGRPQCKTISTLEKYKIPKDKITIYVVEEEYELYKKIHDYIVIGVKGIVAQRKFIEDQYPEGTHLVFMDDDLDDIDLSLSPYITLMDFLEDAFKESIAHGAYLWGVYAVYNPYFRKARTPLSTCLNFCVGCLYGIITRKPSIDITISKHGNKEDVERSIRYFIRDGVVLRFNRIAPKTKYYGSHGGLGTKRERMDEIRTEAYNLAEAFPNYGKIKVRKNGLTEFNLKKLIRD